MTRNRLFDIASIDEVLRCGPGVGAIAPFRGTATTTADRRCIAA